MRKIMTGAVLLACGFTSANAAIYAFRLQGTVTEMTSPTDAESAEFYSWNPGPNEIKVGDTVNFSASVDRDSIVKWAIPAIIWAISMTGR